MAKERITMIKLKRLLQLLSTGLSLNKVCAELRMSKTTVVNYKKSAERTGMSMRDLYALDDAHVTDRSQNKGKSGYHPSQYNLSTAVLQELYDNNKPCRKNRSPTHGISL